MVWDLFFLGKDDWLRFEGLLRRRVGFHFWGWDLRGLFYLGEGGFFEWGWGGLDDCAGFLLLFPHHHDAFVGTHLF